MGRCANGRAVKWRLSHPLRPSLLLAMSFFARPHYTSEATQFIEQLKTDHPQLEQEQRQGRALLWDKQIDRGFQTDAESARVAQQPYVYQTGSEHR